MKPHASAIGRSVLASLWIAFGQAAAQTGVDARVVVVPGVVGDGLHGMSRAPLIDLTLGGRGSYLLDSGTEIGFEVIARGVRNSRDGFAGTIAVCPPEHIGCPYLTGALGRRVAPVSPTTGLTTVLLPPPPEARIGLDTALVSVSGGWGEVALGRDVGAALRLDARAPSVLSASGPTLGVLDPLGAVVARARNDPGGSAFKASFFSPRLFGIRAGLSVTPGEAEVGVAGPHTSATGARLGGLIEAALSFSYRFAGGRRVRSAATYASGSSSGAAGYGQYQAIGLGLEVEEAGWRVGGRWLMSNNARNWDGSAYRAIEIGFARAMGPWDFGFEASAASDDLLSLSGYTVAASCARVLDDRVRLAVSVVRGETDAPQPGFVRTRQSAVGVVAEITIDVGRRQ